MARAVSRRLRPVRRSLAAAALAFAALLAAAPAAAQGVLTQEEALRLAFPAGTQVERRTAYLDEAQLGAAQRAAGAGVEVTQRVVTYYLGTRGGRPVGVAYFDSHRVRTLPEVLMIVVDPQARVQRVEVLKFGEPPEYRAPEKWLERVEGKALAPELALKRGVPNLSGATLTAEAVTAAARRVLALHGVVRPLEVRR